MKLTKIDKKEFEKSTSNTLFDDLEFNRAYGILSSENHILKLAWKSDLMNPEIIKYQDYAIIGIDNSVAILNEATLRILVKLQLSWNYQKTFIHNEQIIIATELSVYKFHCHELTLKSFSVLPDIIEDFEVDEDNIQVSCMDGNQYTI